MKLLIVGSGAREHAIVRALLRDENVTGIECAPGNAGIAGDVTTLPLDVTDTQAIAALALERGIDLVVIGPEAPLVAGAADAVRAEGIACFGPSAQAAQLEGSKAFAKEVMAEAGVPTAMALVCTDEDQIDGALDTFTRPGTPYVVKDDGLAGGKGVVVTDDRAVAGAHAHACLAGGSAVVMEEFLETLPNGTVHHILEESDDRPLDNTEVFTVPEGHYFMMGDNRDNSVDSRAPNGVGFVPAVNLVGEADFIFYSTNGYAKIYEVWKWPWTIRFNRIFDTIKPVRPADQQRDQAVDAGGPQ